MDQGLHKTHDYIKSPLITYPNPPSSTILIPLQLVLENFAITGLAKFSKFCKSCRIGREKPNPIVVSKDSAPNRVEQGLTHPHLREAQQTSLTFEVDIK